VTTEIGEPVEVAAIFADGVRPVKFRWKGNVYTVKEITFLWQTTEGQSRVIHFSVTDGSTLYELAYNQSDMRWSLERVEP